MTEKYLCLLVCLLTDNKELFKVAYQYGTDSREIKSDRLFLKASGLEELTDNKYRKSRRKL